MKVKCAYCGKEKEVTPSKFNSQELHFCNRDHMVRYRTLHPQVLRSKEVSIDPELERSLTDLLTVWLKEKSYPNAVGKIRLHGDILERYKAESKPKHTDVYIKRVISKIMRVKFNYFNPEGTLNPSSVLWRKA